MEPQERRAQPLAATLKLVAPQVVTRSQAGPQVALLPVVAPLAQEVALLVGAPQAVAQVAARQAAALLVVLAAEQAVAAPRPRNHIFILHGAPTGALFLGGEFLLATRSGYASHHWPTAPYATPST